MKYILLIIPLILVGCYSSPEEELGTTTRTVNGKDTTNSIEVKVDTVWTDTIHFSF